jgi:hypothetical protein
MAFSTVIRIGATGRFVTVNGETHDVTDRRLWSAFRHTLVDAFAAVTGQQPFRPKRRKGRFNHRRRKPRKQA